MGLGDHTNQRPEFWEIILFKGFFLGPVPRPGASEVGKVGHQARLSSWPKSSNWRLEEVGAS